MGSVAGKSSTRTSKYRRSAHHAGSWYDDNAKDLNQTLEDFLAEARQQSSSGDCLRGLVVPHAGYSYSGRTAAYAYARLEQELRRPKSPIQHIIVLHPSHHVYLDGCAVSGASELSTPVGTLTVDDELRESILALSPQFSVMEESVDQAEHSGEMQYPYLAKVLRDCQRTDVSVLPIMCGALSVDKEMLFGRLLAPILARDNVVAVVSTDFCHWGKRFSYQPTDSTLKVHEFIEQLDRRGMKLIELQEPGAFADYLRTTRNTICGRHAVAVWLRALEAAKDTSKEVDITFVRYAQSSPALSMRDSSVSYAAAVATTST